MAAELEERAVEVNLPTLSADANHRLTESLREIIGADTVRVPADRPHPSHGERPHGNPLQRMTTLKAITLGLSSVALCVSLIIVTALSSDWALTAVAFVALLVTLTAVTASIIALSSVSEYPDAGLVALLSEEGVGDPEVRFSEIVMEFTAQTGDHGERVTEVHEDPAPAIAEQPGVLTSTSAPGTSGADASAGSEEV